MSLVDELAKLEELRRSGALSEAEFTKAKAALLSGATAGSEQQLVEHLADDLAEVKYQNELAQLDREWEIERRQYLIPSQYGTLEPTTGIGFATAFLGGLFGMLVTIVMAVQITSGSPDFGYKVFFTLCGVVITVAFIGYGMKLNSTAQKYQEAFAEYKARRARVKPEPDASADSPRE
jgi:hypothetical protein